MCRALNRKEILVVLQQADDFSLKALLVVKSVSSSSCECRTTEILGILHSPLYTFPNEIPIFGILSLNLPLRTMVGRMIKTEFLNGL